MRRLFVPLAVAAAVLLASACTPSAPTSTIPVSSHSTPSPSATSLDPATQDLRGAEQAVIAMVAKVDALLQVEGADFGSLSEVARDDAFATQLSILQSYRRNGWTQIGNSKVLSPHAVLSSQDHWAVAACVDVADVDVVDKTQKSIVSPSRPPRVAANYQVVKDQAKFYVTRREVTTTC